MQHLCEKVWNNSRLHEVMTNVELDWLRRELGIEGEPVTTLPDAKKIIQAATILASSVVSTHREAAYRIATYIFELYGCNELPFEQALRVILTRLGNFPALRTSNDVAEAFSFLPISLATEEIHAANEHKITVEEQDIYLTSFQHNLWKSLIHDKKTAVSAPTSAGKSFVLQNYLTTLFATDKDNTVTYIVPTRALISQVSEDLSEQLGRIGDRAPSIVTVPIDSEGEIPGRAVFVMTQERLQLQMNAHPEFTSNVIIVDEAQSISDYDRGVLLQWVIDDLLERRPESQILFASPTIRNLDIFGNMFGLEDVIEYKSTEPTVAQNFIIIKINSATKGIVTIYTANDGKAELKEVTKLSLNHPLASGIEKLVHISATLGKGQSSIVYANGPGTAENIALQLVDLLPESDPSPEQLALAQLVSESVHPHYVLCETVKKGVGFHYSNIPTQVRHAVEKATSAGYINYLVSTSTLLQGVNLPTKNIFMCAPKRGKKKPLDSIDFWNLSGRAGRLCREFQGNIFLIDYDKWEKKPLEGPKDAFITPAMEKSVKEQSDNLLSVISDNYEDKSSAKNQLESAFVRLFTDYKSGKLPTTLSRVGISQDSSEYLSVSHSLKLAAEKIKLPTEILRLTPGISAHKQQKLFDYLERQVALGGNTAEALIPSHPREEDAFTSYAKILRTYP